MNSNELKNERQEYIKCLNNVINTRKRIYNSISKLKSIKEILNEGYIIDDTLGGNSYINDIINAEIKIYNNIVNEIVPEINSKIKSLNYEIETAIQNEVLVNGDI